ncbi:Hypothetical predicted protein, partial [Mytilus galloprovincialis]
ETRKQLMQEEIQCYIKSEVFDPMSLYRTETVGKSNAPLIRNSCSYMILNKNRRKWFCLILVGMKQYPISDDDGKL